MNCGKKVNETTLASLPVIEPKAGALSDIPSFEEHLCSSPSEEEISRALSQLRFGKAPGLDGIQTETLRLGGAATVQWLKALFGAVK